MKKLILYNFLLLILLSCKHKNAENNMDKMIVVQWGDSSHVNNSTVKWNNGMTALSALQSVANVETHPVGLHIFVISINDIKSKRGETAWYYKINGKSPKVLAFKNYIEANDTVSWIFKKDICSPKFDSLHSKNFN